MNREHWKELLPVITAYANGEDVQYSHEGKWKSLSHGFDFTERPSQYRVAPKPRKFWVNDYGRAGVYIYGSKDHADRAAANDRIACHEIELPPLP